MEIYNPNVSIVSVKITNEGKNMEVVKREASNIMYACNPPRTAPDRVWKEIYGIGPAGTFILEDKVSGKHTPASIVEEKITFE